MFSSIRTPRVYEHIVAQIERAIYESRLQQGDKLPPERELVRQFSASRVAVREALRALEHRGFVEVRQGSAGGYFIREVDSGPLMRDFQTLFRLRRVSLAQLLEARLLVEPETARLGAIRATDTDLKALRAAIDERAEHTAAGRHAHLRDSEFHRLVAEAARNPVHAAVTQALMDLEIEIVVPKLDLGVDGSRALDAAHREIFDAILARQPERAAKAMERHIRDIEERVGAGAQERAAS